MRHSQTYFLLMALMLLVGAASAMTATTDHEWIVANNADTSIITVQILNYSNDPMHVDFSILPSSEGNGTLLSASDNVDLTGKAVTTFRAGIRSGEVYINAAAYFSTNGTLYKTALITQKIDHTAASRIEQLLYAQDVEVGRTTPVMIKLADANGNAIDNKRVAESVHFIAGSVNGGARFENGAVEIDEYTNESGWAVASLTIDRASGSNWLRVEPPAPLPPFIININGYGAIPVSITPWVVPSGTPYPQTPGDGLSRFILTFTVQDAWGNPCQNRLIRITSNQTGDIPATIATNQLGQVRIYYGPENRPLAVLFDAYVMDNASAITSQIVLFTSTAPVDITLTASSITMSSLDVTPGTRSQIRARVIDTAGSPVPGEQVEFQLIQVPEDYNPYIQTQGPYLVTPGSAIASATTDANGSACVEFAPGKFLTNKSAPGYSTMATASVTIVATWKGISRDLKLTYKNYPYLRVETEVTNSTLEPGGILDITVRLVGDGHELWRDPVDVMLATSRAPYMLQEDCDREVRAHMAEHAFINVLSSRQPKEGYDGVGILSFGNNAGGKVEMMNMDKQVKANIGLDGDNSDQEGLSYINSNYPGNGIISYTDVVTVEHPMVPDLTDIASAINFTTPFGEKSMAGNVMPVRRAIYESVNNVRNGENAVRAIILLVDSSITDYGDVLAEGNFDYNWRNMAGGTNRYYPFPGPDGTWNPDVAIEPRQNMAIWAKENNVKVYIVYVAAGLNSADQTTYETLAAETGGNFNNTAGMNSNLEDIYRWIAEQLVNEAAVNATMALDMVAFAPGSGFTYSAGDIFTYEHLHNAPVNSTEIHHFSWRDQTSPYFVSNVVNPPIAPWVTNDSTADWFTLAPPDNEMYSLYFDVGTIRVKETWETKFRLKVKDTITETLQFRLFSGDSIIQFENDPGANLNLYNSSPLITILQNSESGGIGGSGLRLRNLVNSNAATMIEFADLGWEVNYTGMFEFNETLSYQYQNPATWSWSPKVTFDVQGPYRNTSGWCANNSRMDIRDLPHGTYRILLEAMATDGPSANLTVDLVLGENKKYIILK